MAIIKATEKSEPTDFLSEDAVRLRGVKKQLAAADHTIEVQVVRIRQLEAEVKAFDMWTAYFLHKFGTDGELRINEKELYGFKNGPAVRARLDEEKGEIRLW